MTRFDPGSRITVKPMSNVYTALAMIAALSTLAALIYFIVIYNRVLGF